MSQTVRGRLLIVDDEPMQLRALCDTLELEGYATRGFGSPRDALAALQPGQYDLLLTDLMMPEMDGIALIAAVRGVDPDIGAVVMTGHGTIDTAVMAMQGGALDYILKPFSLNIARPVISRALNLVQLKREVVQLQAAERQRAEELAAAYADLESFSYSISHDLRAPLLFVKDFALRLKEDYAGQFDEEGGHVVQVIHDGAQSMDRMIVGLLRPTSGTAGIGEFDTWRSPLEVKKRIGVLPEEFNLYERLTGAELLAIRANDANGADADLPVDANSTLCRYGKPPRKTNGPVGKTGPVQSRRHGTLHPCLRLAPNPAVPPQRTEGWREHPPSRLADFQTWGS